MSKEELVERKGEEHLRVGHVRSAGRLLIGEAGGKQKLLENLLVKDFCNS